MAHLPAQRLRNIELLAQMEEDAAEDDLAILHLVQYRRNRNSCGVGEGGGSTATFLFPENFIFLFAGMSSADVEWLE